MEQTPWQTVPSLRGHGSLMKNGLGESLLGQSKMPSLSAMVPPSWVHCEEMGSMAYRTLTWDEQLVPPFRIILLSPKCSVMHLSMTNVFRLLVLHAFVSSQKAAYECILQMRCHSEVENTHTASVFRVLLYTAVTHCSI